MKKLCISTLIASSLFFLGCAAPIVEQKGSDLQTFPQAEQLKVNTARPLTLRTETQNKNCDVVTFFQIMSERNPDIQNILDVHYSEVEKNDKTECSYWGIGVTYEGVSSSQTPKSSFAEPIKEAVPVIDSANAEIPVEVKAEAPIEQAEVVPVQVPTDTVKAEVVPVAETIPVDSTKAPVEVTPVAADSTQK